MKLVLKRKGGIMKKCKISASAIDELVKCGLTEEEAITVLCVIEQSDTPIKPSYNIKIERPKSDIKGKGA